MNRINALCTEIVKQFESLHDGDLTIINLQPKMCPAGYWTEGYGNVIVDPDTGRFLSGSENKEKAYALSTVTNEAEASVQLAGNLERFSGKVLRICQGLNMQFEDNKFSALVSFAYNCGAGACRKLLQHIKDGMDPQKAFLLYRYATVDGVKKELPGLIRRRKAEGWLWSFGEAKFYF